MEPTVATNAPRSAFDRIQHRPFKLLLQNGWNAQIETLFRDARDFSTRTIDWSRKKLYGEEEEPSKPT